MSQNAEQKAAAEKEAAEKKAAEQKAAAEKEAAEKAGKKVKVEFLRSHPAYGYFVGDKAEISQADYDKYSKDGPFFKKL